MKANVNEAFGVGAEPTVRIFSAVPSEKEHGRNWPRRARARLLAELAKRGIAEGSVAPASPGELRRALIGTPRTRRPERVRARFGEVVVVAADRGIIDQFRRMLGPEASVEIVCQVR